MTIPEEYLKKILLKTEGWPAAVSLAAMYLLTIEADKRIEAIDTSLLSYKYVIDYFSDSVVTSFDNSVIEFIQDTVLLESFNQELCDFVRRRDDSDRIITRLLKKSFPFLLQDIDYNWKRYHVLFSEYIKSAYRNDKQTEIYTRASIWFALHNNISSALKYAFLSKNKTQINSLVIRYSDTLFLKGRFNIISQFFSDHSEFPFSDPEISIFHLWADYLTHGQASPDIINSIMKMELDDSYSSKDGRLLCLKAWILFDNKDHLCQNYAEVSLSLLENEISFFSGMARLILGKSLLLNGNYAEAAAVLTAAREVIPADGYSFIYHAMINNLIYAFLKEGKLDKAIKTGEDLLFSIPSDEIFKPEKGMILSALARVYLVENHVEKAFEYAEKAVEAIAMTDVNNFIFEDGTKILNEIMTIRQEEPSIPKQAKRKTGAMIESLSRRESEILVLLCDGLSNQQISIKLFISIGTVKWHLNNIFSKMDVKNRTQAVLKAREMSL
ncbi:MAG: hypothetical protein JEZ04_16040 [Spirochaetales bacterium]|nr:hypothetical protein [Spirochaetales bacterium]